MSFDMDTQDNFAAWLPLAMADEAQHKNFKPQIYSSPSKSRSNSTTPELKFVTLMGPPSSRSIESRLMVRSHAMQAFLREKKNDRSVSPKKGPDSQIKKLDDALGRFKLASWSRKSAKKNPTVTKGKKSPVGGNSSHTTESEVPKGIGIVLSPACLPKGGLSHENGVLMWRQQVVLGQLDPFSILPITLTSRTHSLLYHYTTSFTMNSAAVNPEGSWLAFAITDAALLHALLSLVAYHFDLIQGRDESSDSLYQKGEAMREMRDRLTDNQQQISDVSIATVSLFTNLETMSGTKNHADIHMAALERMVGIRGGLDKFVHNKVLQRVLTWSDILYSSTWHCKPRFPLLKSYKDDDLIRRLNRFSSDYLGNFIKYDVYEVFPSNLEMYDVFEMLRRVSRAITDFSTTPQERLALSNQIYFLEHVLLSSSSAPEIHEFPNLRIEIQQSFVSSYEADLSEPFRIAALLYIHIILRELPNTARMHCRLVCNLRLNLEERFTAPFSLASQHTLEILAWICFAGRNAASDPSERHFFVNLLNKICRELNINHKAALREMLRGVIWRDDVGEGYFAGLCDEMTLLNDY